MRHDIEKTEELCLTKNECLFPSIAQEIIDDIIITPSDLTQYHSAYNVENILIDTYKSFVFTNNGSEQIIKQIIETLSKECNEWVIPSPTFELTPFYCKHYDCTIHEPQYEYDNLQNKFFLNLENVIGNTKEQIIYLVSPHNPTGITLSYEDINDLCERYKYVIIDEAYIRPDSSILIRRKNLILIRTFSKMGGITGLRFGIGICFDENLYNKLFQIRPMYINAFTLKCVEYILENFITHKVEKAIRNEVKKLNPFVSAGNFALLKKKKKHNGYSLKEYTFGKHKFYRITICESTLYLD